ncbi:hypothetical protein D3C80_2159890 [compost metagenome]
MKNLLLKLPSSYSNVNIVEEDTAINITIAILRLSRAFNMKYKKYVNTTENIDPRENVNSTEMKIMNASFLSSS